MSKPFKILLVGLAVPFALMMIVGAIMLLTGERSDRGFAVIALLFGGIPVALIARQILSAGVANVQAPNFALATAGEVVMFCTQCGAPASIDQKFCTGCGTKVMIGPPDATGAPRVGTTRSPSAQNSLVGTFVARLRSKTGRWYAITGIQILIMAFMVNKMNDLGIFDDIKGLSLFDTSETIHYRTNSDMAQLLQLQVSLPGDTYAKFDQAFNSIVSVCAASEMTKQSAESASCLTKNMDGKTVNQIIHLGSKLNESSLSINEKLALVN